MAHTTGIKNSGLSIKIKDKSQNNSQLQTEELVLRNPLLFIYKTVGRHHKKPFEMNFSDKIIHQEKFLKLDNLIPILLLIIVWGIYVNTLQDNSWIIVYTVILIVAIFVASRRKSAFTVYDDRIQLRKPLSNKLTATIDFDQIGQIRYEDSFSDSYGFFLFWSDFIIIYPKKEAKIKKFKKDRITLAITGFNRKSKILKLLKFFQSKNLELVIKTGSKKIKNETGLQNWDQG